MNGPASRRAGAIARPVGRRAKRKGTAMKWHYDGPADGGNGAMLHYRTGSDGTRRVDFSSYCGRERDATWYLSGIDGDTQHCATHAEALERRRALIRQPARA